MGSHPPDSPTKLPSYSAPSLTPIRPPSPLTGSPNDPLNSFIAPAGCELILRNPNKATDGSTIKLVKAAITDICANTTDVKDLPLSVVGTGSPAKDSHLSYCYVRLHPATAALDTSPRPDLLWRWHPHLCEALQGWDITWAPQKRWKDKSFWVRLSSPHQIDETEHSNFREAVDNSCKRAGYNVTSSFMMKPSSVGLVMATTSDARRLVEASSMTLDCEPPLELSTAPFRQIDIAWAFELIIGGISSYDCTFISYLDKYFASRYTRDGQSLLHSSRVTEEDFYCFVMFDWETTALVLNDKEAFTATFSGMNLTPPRLLYDVNSNSSYSQRANTTAAIRAAGQDVSKDLENMSRKIEQMSREMQTGFQHAELRLNAVTEKVGMLADSVNTVTTLVHNNTLALLDQREERMKRDLLGQLELSIVHTDMALMRTTDPTREAQLRAKLDSLEQRRDEVRDECDNMSSTINTLLKNPPNPPSATIMAPTEPPGLVRMLLPPPATPTRDGESHTPLTPTTSPIKRSAPPHMETPAPSDPDTPTKKKPRKTPSITRQRTMSTRSTVLQVTSQQELHGDDMDEDGDVPIEVNVEMVSNDVKPVSALIDSTARIDPAEQPMMQFLHSTIHAQCVANANTSSMLNSAGGVRSSRFSRNKTPIRILLAFSLLVWFLSLIQPTSAMSFRASTLSVYALNANGLVHPGKIAHINSAIKARRPHLFVISETKTNSKMGGKLPRDDYNIFEETGVKTDNHHLYKWGIVVGVRKDLQISQQVTLSHSALTGRTIAIDLVLGTEIGKGFIHRFIGTYAPWNPGGADNSFWTQITQICRHSPHSWTLAGDVNATVSALERPTGGLDARRQYLQFLHLSDGLDIWTLNPDRTRDRDWTCRARGSTGGGNIIDRIVASRIGFSDAEIRVADRSSDYIPMTDHRAVMGFLNIHPPPSTNIMASQVKFARETLTGHGKPRLRYPQSSEKHKFENYRVMVDERIKAKSIHTTPLNGDESFISRYDALTQIFKECGEAVFGRAKRNKRIINQFVTSPRIQRLQSDIKHLGGALRMTQENFDGEVSIVSLRTYQRYLLKFQTDPGKLTNLRSFLLLQRRILYKNLYNERMSEIYMRAQASDKKRVANTLRGGSAKKLTLVDNYFGMPTALNSADGDTLVTDPETVKSVTREYWSKLYTQQDPPDVPKPWLSTPSVIEVYRRVEKEPFQWPVPSNIADFRAMLRRGNHRPAPGPDEWEKWCIKNLSDFALSLVLDLHNYEVMNSKFPGDIKDMWLTYMHKRGIRTNLINYRGLMLSNFLANSPMTWLNYRLIPYVAKLNIIPETQVATQQGVQTRDVMSYLSCVKCYAERHHQTVYALQRDQMKGFDYLAPSGFYDALKVYGFPNAICDLDKAAQTQTKAFIRTAYGVTGPIVIDGLTKQGGPLSPIKSTLTTSLGHRYLEDLASSDQGALVMTSKANKANDFHTPDDYLQARITMVEATDDSYIFATSLTTLQRLCLEAERFQYAYGWLTQWTKTRAYVIYPGEDSPLTVTMPSITVAEGIHPWTISQHEVPLKAGELEFLRAKVDDPGWRYQGLKEFIESYKFPKLTMRTPITLLRKITAQCIVARCRALISIQPIKNSDALLLDKQIAGKVHMALGFPYRGNTEILTLPTERHGMDFPSIARINTGLVIEGIARDLNHHIPAYRRVALITLADWTCTINGCIGPLDGLGLSRNFTQYYRRIPAAWIVAQDSMASMKPKLSLRLTDNSHIMRGEVSISHTVNSCRAHGIDTPNGHAIRSLRTKGIHMLSHAGQWIRTRSNRLIFKATDSPAPQARWTETARRHWGQISSLLNNLSSTWLFNGESTLMVTRKQRQVEAEDYIRGLSHILSMPPSTLPHQNRAWGSDGSMIPATSGIGDDKSVTAAVTGPQTIVVRLSGRNMFVLHGELVGLIMGLVLSDNNTLNNKLFTDHLNSARFIDDTRTSINQENRLRNMNGRSYYRWIMDLVRRGRTEVIHTKAHTNQVNLSSLLNKEADHYASKSQNVVNCLHPAPIPTFFMDNFTFYRPHDGWIESNIRTFVDHFVIQASSLEILKKHRYRMAKWLYNPRPPPTYPYIKATAAYSAAVQWYARSGQLPTAAGMKEKGQGRDTRCRMGCDAIEDTHHVFVACKSFDKLRADACREMVDKTRRKIEAIGLEAAQFISLLKTAESLFSDCPVTWPLHYSFYYVGHIPKLDAHVNPNIFENRLKRERFIHNISGDWHMSAIRLASRIWGKIQKEMAKRRDILNKRR
jgi:hypothetical protein